MATILRLRGVSGRGNATELDIDVYDIAAIGRTHEEGRPVEKYSALVTVFLTGGQTLEINVTETAAERLATWYGGQGQDGKDLRGVAP